MSTVLYELILWMPALVIFPLTRLTQADNSLNDVHEYSIPQFIAFNMYQDIHIKIRSLNDYKKILCHLIYKTAYSRGS